MDTNKKENADKLFNSESYLDAIIAYDELLDEDESGEIFFKYALSILKELPAKEEAKYFLSRSFEKGYKPTTSEFNKFRSAPDDHYLVKAGDEDFSKALNQLSYHFMNAERVRWVIEYFKRAISSYEKLDKYNNAENFYRIAYSYQYLADRDKSSSNKEYFKKFISYFEKAASYGHSKALDSLGDCYSYAFGVAEDYSKAFALYQEAYKNDDNNLDALYHLGLCYLYGKGVSIDKSLAASYLNRAANKGHKGARDVYYAQNLSRRH